MNKFLFVHVPKTAGTSITKILYKINSDDWNRNLDKNHHDSFLELKLNNKIDEDVKVFSVVRNPYTRAISYYFHFRRVNELNCTFEDFLKIVQNKEKTKLTPMIIYDQTHYILNNNKKIFEGHIFRYEALNEVENFLNLRLPKKNVGIYPKEIYKKIYTNKNIEMVKNIYSRDFEILNYSKNFYDSICP